MITVYTTGVFDLFHPGHINLLRRARALGDKLIVGLQEDDSVEAQKGRKPIMSYKERKTMLLSTTIVDEVIPYHDLDQRKTLKVIKPDIVVQGGDWLKTGNRTTIIDFLRKNNIKLVQFPYTKNISSTDIKERVYDSLNKIKKEKLLEFDLNERLKIIQIESLMTYEDYDPIRTKKIIDNIVKSGYFINPIIVGTIGQQNRFLVVDGANRLQAMRELGAKCILAQVVDYLNPDEIELRGNEHYLDMPGDKFLELMRRNNLKFNKLKNIKHSQLTNLLNDVKNLCLIYLEKEVYSIPACGTLKNDLGVLNKLIRSYKGKAAIKRKSEVGNLVDNIKVLIKFKNFSPSDIVEAVLQKLRFESGITWHLISNNIIHFKVPAHDLITGFEDETKATAYIKKIIKEKTNNLSIRRYLSNVYVCDEWEL